MDDLDEKILRVLNEDGRASYMDIGRKIGLSEGAVRKRIKTMMDTKVINRFTVQLGFTKGAKAVALLSVNPQIPTSAVSESLRRIPGVEVVYEVTGQYDIAAIVSTLSIVEVNQCIEKMRTVKGVTNTNTMIILRQW